MSDEAKKEIEAEVTETPKQEESGPELTVSDLNALKQIIDVASTRGAFRPGEMTTVGSVYTKLETFLTAVTAKEG